MISLRKSMWKVTMVCGPVTKELWAYNKVNAGDVVTDQSVPYTVIKVIKVISPGMQGTHLRKVEEE